MAKLEEAFDSSQHEEMSDFTPVPAAEYNMQITKSDVKVTSKKDGKYISLEFTILDGEFKGRKVWQNLNIRNPNPQTVEIAQKELTTICKACGVGKMTDTQQLHGIPMKVKVGIKPKSGDWPAKNVPKFYESLGSAPKKAPGKAAGKAAVKSDPVVDDKAPGWD